MSDHHARSARDDVYDHEHEEPGAHRRRRPVADWGVGEDMFEHMPRNRRFGREGGDRHLRAVEGESGELREPEEAPEAEAVEPQIQAG